MRDEKEIPTEPHNEIPAKTILPPAPPITLELIWEKICHLERKQGLLGANLDLMHKFLRSSVRQIEDSDIIDRVEALERVALGIEPSHQNGGAP